MKSKSGFYSSSLEMLLDTMCNMLGAIVFIALMVALLAQDTPTPQTEHPPAPRATETLAALTASNKMADDELQKTLQRLQDPHLHAVTNAMRLPNISNTTNHAWPVIVRYGKLYPLNVLSTDGRGTILRNNHSLNRQSRFVEARQGMGDDPDQGVVDMVEAFKANGRADFYFTFWVFADSFNEFIRAREAVMRLGFQYGWEPLPMDQRLQLGTEGERVLPQN
jgi:hypothetical protein